MDPRADPIVRRRVRINPTLIALLVLVALIGMVAIYAATRDTDQDKLKDGLLTQANGSDPSKRCSSTATYDLIKRSLFQHAAQLRGSDQEAFDQIGQTAILRMENPVMESQDKDSGGINCSGSLSLDLPPGVAIQSGQRTLMSDVDYTIQPSDNDGGDTVLLRNADAIITPLATLARTEEPTDAAGADDNSASPDVANDQQTQLDGQPQVQQAPQMPSQQAPATARPSFDCGNAQSRGEMAVCSDAGLAALDRSMTAQYRRALTLAPPDVQDQLRHTGQRFIAYRDHCPTKACVGDAYEGRMREIRDIMQGRWQPQR